MDKCIDGVLVRSIPGFDGYYISRNGEIWSERQSGKWLTPTMGNSGYLHVGLRNGLGKRLMCVHRLVADAWVANPNGFEQVNHKDENKTNNFAENLEWCTPAYNSNYGSRNRRISKPVVNVTTGVRYPSITAASTALGISGSQIGEVCNHKPKRHTAGGYRWAFESEV